MGAYLGANQIVIFGGQPSGGGDINNQDKTVTPSESSQSITADAGYTGLGTVTVNAIFPTYVGSGIDRRDSTDLSASGATVSVPSGYYENSASKSVSSGTEGTPTATKGAVSNHSVSVTPSVTNTSGYITGSTITGTPVTVSASELVSGSETKTENGTYDVTNLASLIVNVSGGGGGGDLDLLTTQSLGTISTTSTAGIDTGLRLAVRDFQNYDLLISIISADTKTDGMHVATANLILLTGNPKSASTLVANTWNMKLLSTGRNTNLQSTTKYGVYVSTATFSSTAITLAIYAKYNSTHTSTINNSYTLRLYGVRLIDLI